MKGGNAMRRSIKVKPGKAQSTVGFVVGLIFVGIGVIVVIPTFGPFGIFWTLIAVAITVTNGVNAFGKKGVASHEIIIEESGGGQEDALQDVELLHVVDGGGGGEEAADVLPRLGVARNPDDPHGVTATPTACADRCTWGRGSSCRRPRRSPGR